VLFKTQATLFPAGKYMLSVWKMPYHAQENKFPGSAGLLAVWLLPFKSWANRYREQRRPVVCGY